MNCNMVECAHLTIAHQTKKITIERNLPQERITVVVRPINPTFEIAGTKASRSYDPTIFVSKKVITKAFFFLKKKNWRHWWIRWIKNISSSNVFLMTFTWCSIKYWCICTKFCYKSSQETKTKQETIDLFVGNGIKVQYEWIATIELS